MFVFLIGALLVLTFNGLVLFSLFKKTSNLILRLGAGMIVGPLSFLLILSISSYFFKGEIFINILFLLFFLLCIFLAYLSKFKFQKENFENNKMFLGPLIIYILLIIAVYPVAVSRIHGGSYIYNSIATSFARGNYPTLLPHQPQFLTGYHHGTFILEGALNVIGPVSNIDMVHHIFSVYLIVAIFLLVTGIAGSIIPAVSGLILFSGANVLGGGVWSLEDLYFIIFYTFGLSAFILFLYLLKENAEKLWLKYLLLLICLVLILSIDETLFLINLPIFIFFFLYEYKKKIVPFLAVFVILFFVIQNPIRDSMFSPKGENPRFSLFYPYLVNVQLPQDSPSYQHYKSIGFTEEKEIKKKIVMEILKERIGYINLVIIPLFLISIFLKNWWSRTFFISALIAYISGILITNTYYPNNYYRFFNLALQLQMFGLGFLIIDIFKRVNKKFLIPAGLIFIILFSPSIISIHERILKEASKVKYLNYSNYSNKMRDFIKPNEKVIIVGSYVSNIHALTLNGYLIPMGPIEYKVLTPEDIGIEFFDAYTFLSPYALKDLKVDLVFILNEALPNLSENRIKQIIDDKYFTKLYEDANGKLYKVSGEFKNLEDEEWNIKKVARQIPDGALVYLDEFDDRNIPKVLIGEISKRVNLIGFPYSQGGGNYLYVETHFPYFVVCLEGTEAFCQHPLVDEAVSKVEYILANSKRSPESITKKGEFIKIVELKSLILWKNIN